MSFWKSLERKVLRPVGKGLKAAAPVIGGVAGSFIPGIGTIAGSALGSAIGGQVKKGKFDAGALLKDAGMGVLTGGVMSKLGGGSFLGAAKPNPLNSLKPTDMRGMIGMSGVQGMEPVRGALGTMGARAGGIGSALGSALKDGKTWKAIGDTAMGGYQAVQQDRQLAMQREQMARQNRLEDEERARRQALDPARAKLLEALFARMGLTQPTGARL